MPYLPLRCAWTHFAPSQETLAVTYDPPDAGRLVSVQLEVRDYAGAVVYRSAALDCQGGPAPLDWTGALNVGNDAVHEPFATPLRAPYTLRVDAVIAADEDEDLRQPEDLPNSELDSVVPCEALRHDDEPRREDVVVVLPPPPPSTAQVNVLYHSVDVVRGPWLASGAVFVRGTVDSICHKLNQLGYYAGPPARASVTPDYFNKAKERFRRNHGDLRILPAPTNLEFEDALDGALAHHHGARPTLADDQGVPVPDGTALGGNGAPLRVYVEAVGFDEDLANRTDEFMRQLPPGRGNAPVNWAALHNKTASEAGKLNRPLVPLEAVIYLKGHDNRRVVAPQAVGAVRVDWSALEPGEDVSHLPMNDRLHSGTRAYINRVLRSDYVDLERNLGSTNCPAAYGGIRTRAQNFRNPFWREPQPYAPYAVPTEDAGNKVLWAPACTDTGQHLARVGRSGIYLQPSLIGGDRYQVRARLSYEGRGNAAALEIANPVCKFETKPIVVWRRVEVFGVVGWPLRNHGQLPQKCRARYAESYLDVDFTHTLYRRISQVINNADYANWFNHIRTNVKPSVASVVGLLDTLNVHDASPVVRLNPVAVLSSTDKDNIFMFVSDMFNEMVTTPNVASAGGFLLSLISDNIRTGHAPCGGIVMLEYMLSDDIRNALETSEIGEVPTTSNGNNDLLGIIDQRVNANADFVFTHEVGHCFWLTHHEASMGVVKQHHDQFDHNCMMSYPDWDGARPQYPHQAANTYDPHFCGKCNLKLRGWDITHADILTLDTATPPDQIKTLFYYDRADPGLQWDVELSNVSEAFTRVSRGPFRERHFNQNANFDTWMTDLGDCDIYHHVTHGNVRCSRHGSRLASMDMAIPRYPTWCRSDNTKVQRLTTEEQDLCVRTNFDAQSLTAWAKKNFITPQTYWHDLTSVIQWTVDINDSSRDVEFTYEQVQRAFKRGQNAPRLLAFFSSCLIGWERRFAKLFIDQGTRYVIAFRSRYQTSQALPFSREFYRLLSAGQFDAGMINGAFTAAALSFPHAEPCLFTAANITRCTATTRAGTAAFTQHTWKDDAFEEPRFPTS